MRFTLVILRALAAALLVVITVATVAVMLWQGHKEHAAVYGIFLGFSASLVAPASEDLNVLILILKDRS